MPQTIAIAAAIVVLLIAGVLIRAATRPDTFTVQRSTTVAATASQVFAAVDDFRRWSAWSSWEQLDPSMRRTFGGAPAGQGATYAWIGNRKAGEGRMEIVRSMPAEQIGIQLDFIRPFKTRNAIEFTFASRGIATEVTWTMRGPAPFASKLMQVFVDLDTLIGKDFERGLANLKAVVEGSA